MYSKRLSIQHEVAVGSLKISSYTNGNNFGTGKENNDSNATSRSKESKLGGNGERRQMFLLSKCVPGGTGAPRTSVQEGMPARRGAVE